MGLLAETGFPTVAVLGFLCLAIGFLLMRSHRYFGRQNAGRSDAASRRAPASHEPGTHPGAPDDAIRWEVQMHETARELCGQLNSKMSVLEHWIREADRAARRLESALEAARQGPTSAADSPPAPAPGFDPPDEPHPPSTTPINQAEALRSAGARGLGAATRRAERRGAEPAARAERRYDEIYLLADYGFDPVEIARRTGSPVGEVELILGLRARREG